MAKQKDDKLTIDFITPKRGRPVSPVPALTPAQRQAIHRQKLREQGRASVTVSIPADLLEKMRKYVEFKDLSLDDAFERACANFVRKR